MRVNRNESDCSKTTYTTEKEARDVVIKCKRSVVKIKFLEGFITVKNVEDFM